ncbi:uncharacterized protein FN964_013102 isoform 1-T1 [Alca torda]
MGLELDPWGRGDVGGQKTHINGAGPTSVGQRGPRWPGKGPRWGTRHLGGTTSMGQRGPKHPGGPTSMGQRGPRHPGGPPSMGQRHPPLPAPRREKHSPPPPETLPKRVCGGFLGVSSPERPPAPRLSARPWGGRAMAGQPLLLRCDAPAPARPRRFRLRRGVGGVTANSTGVSGTEVEVKVNGSWAATWTLPRATPGLGGNYTCGYEQEEAPGRWVASWDSPPWRWWSKRPPRPCGWRRCPPGGWWGRGSPWPSPAARRGATSPCASASTATAPSCASGSPKLTGFRPKSTSPTSLQPSGAGSAAGWRRTQGGPGCCHPPARPCRSPWKVGPENFHPIPPKITQNRGKWEVKKGGNHPPWPPEGRGGGSPPCSGHQKNMEVAHHLLVATTTTWWWVTISWWPQHLLVATRRSWTWVTISWWPPGGDGGEPPPPGGHHMEVVHHLLVATRRTQR